MSVFQDELLNRLLNRLQIWKSLGHLGFLGGSDGKESSYNVVDPGFDPWVGKIPWRRAWQPTPVFLPGECPWTKELGGLQSMGSQRVGHD